MTVDELQKLFFHAASLATGARWLRHVMEARRATLTLAVHGMGFAGDEMSVSDFIELLAGEDVIWSHIDVSVRRVTHQMIELFVRVGGDLVTLEHTRNYLQGMGPFNPIFHLSAVSSREWSPEHIGFGELRSILARPESRSRAWRVGAYWSAVAAGLERAHVDASSAYLSAHNPDIVVEGLEALESLAEAGLLESVGDISLVCSWRSCDLENLLASPLLESVTCLELNGAGLTDEDVRGIALSDTLYGLRSLSLCLNRLSSGGARVLATSPALSSLEVLALDYNRLGDGGVVALGEGGLARRVRELSLAGNSLTSEGVNALCVGGFERLTTLSLGHNMLGSKGINALTPAPLFAQLEALELAGCLIGAVGAQALATSNADRLRELGLRANLLGDEGARQLAGWSEVWLEDLDLAGNGIGQDGITVLSGAEFFTRLKRLSLWGNPLGRQGARAVAERGASALELLDTRCCDATE